MPIDVDYCDRATVRRRAGVYASCVRNIVLILTAAFASQASFAEVHDNHVSKPSEIAVQPKGSSGYQLTLKSSRSSTVVDGQKELMPKVAQLCAPRTAFFGKYSFELAEPLAGSKDNVSMLVLRQDIECHVAPSAEPPPVAQTGTAPQTATPEQVHRVEQQTRLYFEAKDHGRYLGAYDLMAASLKQGMTFDIWKGKAEAFNAKAGPVERRTISKITWYHNPPHVEPGLYAAVDFTSKFAEVDFHCGFLAWREQLDGKFVLVREEENYLDKQTELKLAPGDLEKLRQKFNCK